MKFIILSTTMAALVAAGPGINPNPDPNFDPSTSPGTFGPFIPAQRAAASAQGGQTNVDQPTLQAMQLAISNWQTDTGIVSMFQDTGKLVTDSDAFKGIADGAFKAEVDELSQKAVLDQVIGNDPRVSVANLTLTNGVFQSVVDNLQIMSIQGQAKVNLIDSINSVRCTQILPSIDTYMLVAAEYIGQFAQQRRAVRPDACGQILSAASADQFPNVPATPNGNPNGVGDGIVQGVPNACEKGGAQVGNGGGNANNNNNANTNVGNNDNNNVNANTNAGNNNANTNAGNGDPGNAANSPLNVITTPQLDLPAFGAQNQGNAQQNRGNAPQNQGNGAQNQGNAAENQGNGAQRQENGAGAQEQGTGARQNANKDRGKD